MLRFLRHLTALHFSTLGVCLSLLLALAADAQPTMTHYAVAGGTGAAAVRLDDGRLDTFRPHIYRALDDGLLTPELCFDAYFGLRRSGSSRWLTDFPPSLSAVAGANILIMQQDDGPLSVRTHIFAPYDIGVAAVVMMAEISNVSMATVSGIAVPTLHNFHLGSGPSNFDAERARFDTSDDSWIETGARGALVVHALTLSSDHLATPQNPYAVVTDNLPFITVDDSGLQNDVVHGFVFSPTNGELLPGASFQVGIVIASSDDGSPEGVLALQSTLQDWIAGRSPDALLLAETGAATSYGLEATLPNTLSSDERALAQWSLATLRAAQVLEVDTGSPGRRPQGQIVASLPPGIWNITWVRDAAYAIEGLLDVGQDDAAEAALRFMLDGTANEYIDPYVGSSYLLSVTRYFGGGREESDWNSSGPNIEWDNFGLFLHAFARGLEEGLPLAGRIDEVKTGVADVLLSLVDAENGLLVADSSIWETHWDISGESVGRRQYAYSTAMAAAGLQRFANILSADGDPDAERYAAAAVALAEAMQAELVIGTGLLAASREDALNAPNFARDASVVESFNRDVLDATGTSALATLEAMASLRASASAGYFRNDEGGAYDNHEWLVIDLWLSRAFRRAGQKEEADRLLAHVTEVGLANLGHLPELLHSVDGRAFGSIPMMGFGPGAYLTALVNRTQDNAIGSPAPDPPVTTDAGTTADGGTVLEDAGGPINSDAGEMHNDTDDAGTMRFDAGGPGMSDAGRTDAGGAGPDAGPDDRPDFEPVPMPDVEVETQADAGSANTAPFCRCVQSRQHPPAAALLLAFFVLWRRRRG